MQLGLPEGEIAFVFTDIEGSTALLHELGERYVGVLDAHNRLIRQALTAHRGIEVKTEGDAFFAVFTDADDAVAACLEAQRLLATHDWPHGEPVRVRMGVHVGHGQVVEDDYVGIDVHEAARVADAANGGQVLVTGSVVNRVDGKLPDGAGFHDVGRHVLKDFPEPQPLYLLTHPDLEAGGPPPRTLSGRDHNLPVPPTALEGRDHELRELVELLVADARLVTLTGIGGVGKTRLAVEAGWRLLSWFRDGVWLVPLAAVTEPGEISAAVAAALGLPEQPGRTPMDVLTDHLASRTALLVTDNWEQVLDGAPAVSALLERCPDVRVLATSRERLRLRGEHLVSLDPLPVPPAGAELDDVAASPAARLLVNRLSALRPDLRLDAITAGPLAEICRKLDGIPLALELAAGHATDHGLDEVVRGLDASMDLLTEGERDLPERQRQLRSTIAWSEDLLDPPTRTVLRATAPFLGGFTDEAVCAVARSCDGELTDADVSQALRRLVDANLVRRTDDPGRWTLLEPVRQYLVERVNATPAVAEAATLAHAAWYRRLASQLAPALVGADQGRALAVLEDEHDNLRRAIETAPPADAARLGADLIRFWSYRGHWREGRSTLERLLAGGVEDDAVCATLHLGAGNLALQQQDLDATRPHLEAAVTLAERSGAPDVEALARNLLGTLCAVDGDAEAATAHWERAADAAVRAGDRRTEALVRQAIGTAAFQSGDLDTAESAYQAARDAQVEIDDAVAAAQSLANLAAVASSRGELDLARRRCEQAVAEAEAVGNAQAEMLALSTLCITLQRSDDVEASLEYANRFVALAEQLGLDEQLARALQLRGAARSVLEPTHAGIISDFERSRRLYLEAGLEAEAAELAELLAALRATDDAPAD